ncbi:MAG: aromatic ring-cleaving dioxygenase [Desulforhopalus sp.]|jgi:aromatic ring-cleaving dioxygenase
MNTNAFITFNTLLLIVVYLLVYRFDPEYEENMAKFIPNHAIVYFEQRDVKSAIHTFRNSQLGRNFDSIDFATTGKKIGVSSKVIDAIEIIQNDYTQVFENDILDELLGKRFAMAIFWPEKDINEYDYRSFLKENSVIVAEPKHRPELLQYIAEHSNKKIRGITLQTIQYGNHQISRITSPEGQISLSVIEGLVVTSFNEKLLKHSIDAYDDEVPSIYNSGSFKKSQEEFVKPQRFIYFPINTLKEVAYQFLGLLDPAAQKIIETQLENTEGFSGISYGAWPAKKFVQDKIVFSYNAKLTNPVVRKHLKTIPTNNSMLELTTRDPLAYYWSNTIDVRHFLGYFPPDDKQDNPIRNYLTRLETLSHRTVEEILGTLGDEVSLVVEKSSDENFIPVPLGAAFFRVDTTVDLSEFVNYIVDAFEVPVIETVYNSVTYLYWVASPQDGLQPLCGFWSNLFFIGNSAQLIERVIDGYNENTSLLSNPQIKGIDPGITMENNSITYFNNVEMIGLSQRLLSAVSTMISMEDRGKAEKARVIINEVVNPLLNGLKEYNKSCTRSYFAPGMVVIDSRTSIASKNSDKEAK